MTSLVGDLDLNSLKPNQAESEAEVSHIPVRLCSGIIYPMMYSPFVCDTGFSCLLPQTMALQMLEVENSAQVQLC